MAAPAERAVRYDFERGLGSIQDLVAVVETNRQRRAKLVDKLAKKRPTLKSHQIRFGDSGREAFAVSFEDLQWAAAELGNPEALLQAVGDLKNRITEWRLRKDKRDAASKPVTVIRYDAQRGAGSVYDTIAVCRGVPAAKITRAVVAPLLAKYNVAEDDTFQFPGKGQRPTPVAPFEILRRIVCDHQSPEAHAALNAAAGAVVSANITAIRYDAATRLGALYDVCALCNRPRSALRDFVPAMLVSTVFPGKGQPPVPAAPPDVLAAAAYHLGRPDVAGAISENLPGRSAVFPNVEAAAGMAAEAPDTPPPRWVTPDMALVKYGEYVRFDTRSAPPRNHKAVLTDSDWSQLLGETAPEPPAAPSKTTTTKKAGVRRLDVRYEFSDVWVHRLLGRFVSLLPENRRAAWYYWPAAEERALWSFLEHAAVGVLVDELVSRGTVVLGGGSVSLWKLVEAARALGRAEGRRLAHAAASHLAYDTLAAKCRSEFGPWPTWRGACENRFDYTTNKPVRGLLACGNSETPAPPLFLGAWPGVRAELCTFGGGGSSGGSGKNTFFVVRGMSLLGDDQKDIEGCDVKN